MAAFAGAYWTIRAEGDALIFRDMSSENDNRFAFLPHEGHKEMKLYFGATPVVTHLPTYNHHIQTFENGWEIREIDDILIFFHNGEPRYSFHPGSHHNFGAITTASDPSARADLLIGVRWIIHVEGGVLVVRDRISSRSVVDSRFAFFPSNGQVDL